MFRTFAVTNKNTFVGKAVRAHGGAVAIAAGATEVVVTDLEDWDIGALEGGHNLEFVEMDDETVPARARVATSTDPEPEPEADTEQAADERKEKALQIMRDLPLESFTEDKTKPKIDPVNAQMHPMDPITAAERDEWWAIIEAERE
ncbi:MAG: hypothetical protein AAFR68_08320 [Pseudomonadota bacterium]